MSVAGQRLPRTRGRLVAVEGATETDKATLRRELAGEMARYGLPVRLVDPPEPFDLGGRLLHALASSGERVVPTCRVFTRLATYAQLAATAILPELALGRWVIVQSYLDELMVDATTHGWLTARDLAMLVRVAAQGASPDLTLYIDRDSGETRERWLRYANAENPRVAVLPCPGAGSLREAAFRQVRHYILRAGQS